MADKDRTDATDEASDNTAAETKPQGFDAIVAEDMADTVAVESETVTDTETTEETQEDESTVEVESISDEQYAEAGKLGISRAQADEIGVDGLPRVMRKLVAPDSAQTSDAPVVGDAAQETASGKQADVTLDPDEFDSKLIERIEGIESEVARRLGPMQDELHRLRVDAEMNAERESKARFDGLLRNLDGFDKEFGTTSPTRTQQANRNAIRTQMDAERSGRELHSLPNLPDDQLLQRALAGEFSNKAKQQAREEITSALTTRSKKMISRPTQSKGPKLSGRQKAIRSVRAKLEVMGKSRDSVIDNQEDEASVFDT